MLEVWYGTGNNGKSTKLAGLNPFLVANFKSSHLNYIEGRDVIAIAEIGCVEDIDEAINDYNLYGDKNKRYIILTNIKPTISCNLIEFEHVYRNLRTPIQK